MGAGRGVVLLLLLLSAPLSLAGLLGAGDHHNTLSTVSARGTGMVSAAGTGEGSCKAPPYRAETVAWPEGCPDYAPCCSEYGYCHARDR